MALMKRTTTLLVAILAAALALAAISCSGEPPTSVDAIATSPTPMSGTGVASIESMHIVNGKGSTWVGDPWNAWINISFHAKLDPDGGAKGSWHHQFPGNVEGGRVVVRVTCLSVAGNQAWMAGYSTQAGNPNNIGKWFGLHVIDNGEGQATIDEMSRTRWFGFDEQAAMDFCEFMTTDHEVWPITAGNVQVR